MTNIFSKLKETSMAILPLVFIVILFNFTVVNIPDFLIYRFLISAIMVLIGLTLFLFGVDLCIHPMSSETGVAIAKKNNIYLVIFVSLLMGFVISIAEPDLLVLANQISNITEGALSVLLILTVVSAGMAIMIMLGFLRILFRVDLNLSIRCLYTLILIISIFVPKEFLAIAFDSSGATTGILAVPFMLAFSSGIAYLNKNADSSADNFGLVALASSGAVMAVLILALIKPITFDTEQLTFDTSITSGIFNVFSYEFGHSLLHSLMAILPLCVIFFLVQFLIIKSSAKRVLKMGKGMIYTLCGLVLFMWGVNSGFIDIGKYLGDSVSSGNIIVLLFTAFLLGVVAVMAEPAVHVLANQINEVTSGAIKRSAVFLPITIGVGMALLLSIIRIKVPAISLSHYVLPGYILALILSFFAPKIFVAIAFDAGGVATGPVTATFILSFTNGVASETVGANVLIDGFGMIAMVALIPIISIELLGCYYSYQKNKLKLQGVK